MLQEFKVLVNEVDGDGNPAGGRVVATGLLIEWQDGPLGRGVDRKEPNGAFVETVIQAAIERLEFYEASKFKCEENEVALGHLRMAMDSLNKRTQARQRREVEGTHAV